MLGITGCGELFILFSIYGARINVQDVDKMTGTYLLCGLQDQREDVPENLHPTMCRLGSAVAFAFVRLGVQNAIRPTTTTHGQRLMSHPLCRSLQSHNPSLCGDTGALTAHGDFLHGPSSRLVHSPRVWCTYRNVPLQPPRWTQPCEPCRIVSVTRPSLQAVCT